MTTPNVLRSFGVNEGVMVNDIMVGKPAAQAGINAGDVITFIDGQKITIGPMLLDIIASSPVDRSVQVKVLRNGKEQTIPVMIGDRERVIDDVDTLRIHHRTFRSRRILRIVFSDFGSGPPQSSLNNLHLAVAISAVQKGSVGAEH